MNIIKVQDYIQPGYVDRVLDAGQDVGVCQIEYADGTVSPELPTRIALFNIMFWESVMPFGVMPTKRETFNIKSFSADSCGQIYTILYDKFLDEQPDADHIPVVFSINDTICRMYNRTLQYFGKYMPSIDGLSLAKLLQVPEIKAIADTVYDTSKDPKAAELQLKHDGRELTRLLRDPNTPDNPCYIYMQAGALRGNSINQMLGAYGGRSDIDDTVKQHMISQSSFSGCRTPEDFAIETLAARKAIFYSRNGIKKSQYFGRKLRLGCTSQRRIHRGNCGSPVLIDVRIDESYANNMIDKIIVHEGSRLILNKVNIKNLYGQVVKMASPFGCRHLDGVCEFCAGYGKDRLTRYMPPEIHIGLHASSNVSSRVSQKILSAKHLVTVNALIYNLLAAASKYLIKDDTNLVWAPSIVKNLKNYHIRIPSDALGPIIDLDMDTLPTAESFSKISYFELVYNGEVKDIVTLESEGFIPYLSEYTLSYLRTNFDRLVVDDYGVLIPMDKFDTKKEVFSYVVLNDDMLAYTKRVSKFLSTDIESYTSVSHALQDFMSVVYEKSSVPMFYLEMVLRSFSLVGEGDFAVPNIVDPYKVSFGKLESVISGRTLSEKLAFERLEEFLKSPATLTEPREFGWFAPNFGIK